MTSNKNNTKTTKKTAIDILPAGQKEYSMEMIEKVITTDHVPKLIHQLTQLKSSERSGLRKFIEEDIADTCVANLLMMALTSKNEKTRMEATNSILDRLNKPRVSGQYKKEQKSTIDHNKVMELLDKTKDK